MDKAIIEGIAAPLPYTNLDTDQIMPKQFLRGIDKRGLDRGLLYDLRFDEAGAERPGFVLNRPPWRQASILVAGANFGCGSSREHAVWGLQQYGIRAVIASSFAEIFFFNAMNNGLLLVTFDGRHVQALLRRTEDPSRARLRIDVRAGVVDDGAAQLPFTLSPRHRDMFLRGHDMVQDTLARESAVADFELRHWRTRPWLKDVARRAVEAARKAPASGDAARRAI
ncbi:3-isopropylmalate dehydratase small subunit [Bordetella genomosp. 9]|uniref:3-isopropylmalate dehydratase small subunit n=1 Tax=Bordetella genomosp. 9 TaxID=1416803 RepID=UPI000A28F0F0|nr:3-isopropylmalate dehydratase small subunit [Bordetella genomosp. 9]ARP92191.1 3-isopropylmalate dehydratase small subunit [Bordetella genomosp. 9]